MHHACEQHKEYVGHYDVIEFASGKVEITVVLLEKHAREEIIERNAKRLQHQVHAMRIDGVIDMKCHDKQYAHPFHEVDIHQSLLSGFHIFEIFCYSKE